MRTGAMKRRTTLVVVEDGVEEAIGEEDTVEVRSTYL